MKESRRRYVGYEPVARNQVGDSRSSRHDDSRSSRYDDSRSSRHDDSRSSRYDDSRSSRNDSRSSRYDDSRSSRHDDSRSSRNDSRSSRYKSSLSEEQSHYSSPHSRKPYNRTTGRNHKDDRGSTCKTFTEEPCKQKYEDLDLDELYRQKEELLKALNETEEGILNTSHSPADDMTTRRKARTAQPNVARSVRKPLLFEDGVLLGVRRGCQTGTNKADEVSAHENLMDSSLYFVRSANHLTDTNISFYAAIIDDFVLQYYFFLQRLVMHINIAANMQKAKVGACRGLDITTQSRAEAALGYDWCIVSTLQRLCDDVIRLGAIVDELGLWVELADTALLPEERCNWAGVVDFGNYNMECAADRYGQKHNIPLELTTSEYGRELIFPMRAWGMLILDTVREYVYSEKSAAKQFVASLSWFSIRSTANLVDNVKVGYEITQDDIAHFISISDSIKQEMNRIASARSSMKKALQCTDGVREKDLNALLVKFLDKGDVARGNIKDSDIKDMAKGCFDSVNCADLLNSRLQEVREPVVFALSCSGFRDYIAEQHSDDSCVIARWSDRIAKWDDLDCGNCGALERNSNIFRTEYGGDYSRITRQYVDRVADRNSFYKGLKGSEGENIGKYMYICTALSNIDGKVKLDTLNHMSRIVKTDDEPYNLLSTNSLYKTLNHYMNSIISRRLTGVNCDVVHNTNNPDSVQQDAWSAAAIPSACQYL